MLKCGLLHPQILETIARAGHHGRILIADGNYPASTTLGPNAKLVSLNLSPGVVSTTQILDAVLSSVPIDFAYVMDYEREGPYALTEDPPVWAEFSRILEARQSRAKLKLIDKWQFYKEVACPSHILTIQSADLRIFANLILDIGVRQE